MQRSTREAGDRPAGSCYDAFSHDLDAAAE